MSSGSNLPRIPGEPPIELAAEDTASEAHRRKYEDWGLYGDSVNPLFTSFRYSRVSGIGSETGVTRRDPSTVLRVDGTYYVWYTHRRTQKAIREGLRSIGDQDWETPVFDWDKVPSPEMVIPVPAFTAPTVVGVGNGRSVPCNARPDVTKPCAL